MERQERRKIARGEASYLIKYKLLAGDASQGEAVITNVKDLGGGGVGLKIKKEVPVGSPIELKINFPGLSAPLTASGKIAWIKRTGIMFEVGVQFITLDDAFRKAILQSVPSAPTT
jgi:hypothetical protein